MYYKPLFIIHAANGLLKSYVLVQKQSASATKIGMAHTVLPIKVLGFPLNNFTKLSTKLYLMLINMITSKQAYFIDKKFRAFIYILTIRGVGNLQ